MSVMPEEVARKSAAVLLIRSHGAALRATARRYSLCADDAEDAFQRGIEILLKKAPSTEPKQLVPWARTVIKHEALAVRRTRERTLGRPPAAKSLDADADWVDLIPSDRDGPEEQMVGREKVARSREALARLKPHELKALTQLAEGYSYTEIGLMNGWTRTKVNRCLAEGRQRFRSAFRESESGERCRELAPLLSACSDGELDRMRLSEVEDHLAVCGSCRATLRTYRAAPKAVAALAPVIPLSRGIWERVQEILVGIHARFSPVADASAGGAGVAETARGAAPLAAKVAAVCAGTGATAAVCVATGVLPTPLVASDPGDRSERSPQQVARTAEPAVAASTEPAADARPAEREPGPRPARSRPAERVERVITRPQPEAPATTPAPTATESEFTPEGAGASVPDVAPDPPSTRMSLPGGGGGGGGSGVPVGGGGEFAP